MNGSYGGILIIGGKSDMNNYIPHKNLSSVFELRESVWELVIEDSVTFVGD